MKTNNIIVDLADWVHDQPGLIALRTRVFVEEQQVPAELELDEMDSRSQHFKALTDQGEIIATARLLPSNYIGRMCVLKAYRNRGLGGNMLSFIIDYARHKQIEQLHLNAQIGALSFYQRYGFEVDSAVFLEAGIEHQHMSLNLL